MSVVSKNPFELLGDDGEERSGSPAPKAAAAKAPAAAQAPKVVPGAAPTKGTSRGGRYPSRGGPRNVYRGPAASDPEPGFDGERVAPAKKEHQGRDRHTKGPREDRTHTGPRARAPGAAGARAPKGQGQGRGPRTGAAPGGAPADQKKAGAAPAEQWGNEEGKAELSAENQGEVDAAAAVAAPEEAAEEEAEPEDTSKTLDQYLAEKAEAALSGNLGKKEARQVEDAEGKTFTRDEPEAFFAGKTKEKAPKEKAAKKEKVYIEVDGQFANPARAPRPERGGRGGGRGGARGAPRGGATRGAARPARQAAVAVNDETAFPALGA